MIILFQNMFFPKEFLECIGYISSHLPKLGMLVILEPVSGAHFSSYFSSYLVHIFLHENMPYIMLYQLTIFQNCTFFSSQDINRFLFLNSSVDTSRHHEPYDTWTILEI